MFSLWLLYRVMRAPVRQGVEDALRATLAAEIREGVKKGILDAHREEIQ